LVDSAVHRKKAVAGIVMLAQIAMLRALNRDHRLDLCQRTQGGPARGE
jgi:hypothetical protein